MHRQEFVHVQFLELVLIVNFVLAYLFIINFFKKILRQIINQIN